MVTVWIPMPLRKFTNGADKVTATGATVADIIEDLEQNYQGLKDKLCENDRTVRRFVNIYLNSQDIRFLQSLDTAVDEGDDLSIMPAIAGGTHGNRVYAPE